MNLITTRRRHKVKKSERVITTTMTKNNRIDHHPSQHHLHQHLLPPHLTMTTSSSSNSSSRCSGSRSSNNPISIMSWCVMICASLYVLSGVTQPILMAYAQHAGLANPSCQLYMLFYYIGPALAGLTLRCRRRNLGSGEKGSDGDNGSLSHPNVSRGNSSTRTISSSTTNNNYHYGATTSTTWDTKKDIVGDLDCCVDDKDIIALYDNDDDIIADEEGLDDERFWPSRPLIIKASAIALFDIFAQSMVYTGNNLAGPTIFSIIYSSVTIWTALYSKFLLSRSLSRYQWTGILLVLVGLSITALDSFAVGKKIFVGACLILVGSSFHGLTYVLSEMIMKANEDDNSHSSSVATEVSSSSPVKNQRNTQQQLQHQKKPRPISIRANCAVQGIVASVVLLLWQIIYTLPRLQSLLLTPMSEYGTSPLNATFILLAITLANLLHSVTFYVTLKHFPGGATSAGVLKGLQAVFVFGVGSIALCGRWGGLEMCWSMVKFGSLVVVVCGVLVYYVATTRQYNNHDTMTLASMKPRKVEGKGFRELKAEEESDIREVSMRYKSCIGVV